MNLRYKTSSPQGIDAFLNGRDQLWTRWLEYFLLRMSQTIFLGKIEFQRYLYCSMQVERGQKEIT